MQTAQQSTLNKHSHFHLAVFLTLCDKALSFLGVTSWMNVRWYLYINVWNRHLIPIPTPIPITTIPTPIPIPITTIPTPIPTPPKWTTNDSDSDSDSGIGVGIVVWFRLRSRNRPRSATNTAKHLGIHQSRAGVLWMYLITSTSTNFPPRKYFKSTSTFLFGEMYF